MNPAGRGGARLLRRGAAQLLRLAAILLLGGFLTAALIRLAPGFGVDERQLDARLGESSRQSLRMAHDQERNVLVFYAHFLRGALRGDLGYSSSLAQPVSALVAARLPLTLRLIGLGLLAAWFVGLALASAAVVSRSAAVEWLSSGASSLSVCTPVAAFAVVLLALRAPAFIAIAVAVFPKVYGYARSVLAQALERPFVLAACARGLSATRILLFHVLPATALQMLTLLGVSVSLALAAAVPVEAVCDLPGIGQLAWKAALGRDLPLLITLTAVVTLITVLANSLADLWVTPLQEAMV